jgi:hypothetical protein
MKEKLDFSVWISMPNHCPIEYLPPQGDDLKEQSFGENGGGRRVPVLCFVSRPHATPLTRWFSRGDGTIVTPAWDLLLHGQDREQNFTKFFTELCAEGTPNPPVRSSLLH